MSRPKAAWIDVTPSIGEAVEMENRHLCWQRGFEQGIAVPDR
jgi:hypothetical protein